MSSLSPTPAKDTIPPFDLLSDADLQDVISYEKDTKSITEEFSQKMQNWGTKITEINERAEALGKKAPAEISDEEYEALIKEFISYTPMRKVDIEALKAKFTALKTDRLLRPVINKHLAIMLYRSDPDGFKALQKKLTEAVVKEVEGFGESIETLNALQVKVETSIHTLKGRIDSIAYLKIKTLSVWEQLKAATAPIRAAVFGTDPAPHAQIAIDHRKDEFKE